jgi:hypothetical protein
MRRAAIRDIYHGLLVLSMVVLLPFAICGALAEIADEFIVEPLKRKAEF